MNPTRSKVQITFAHVEEPPELAPEMSMRGPWWAWAALLAIIATVAFAPAMVGTFLPLDDSNVTENLFLRVWAGLRGIWRYPHQDFFAQFSPLGYSVLMLEYRVWGGVARHAAIGYHLVNLALHIGNTLLLWTLLRKLDLRGAFVAAAIFSAHPVQVQTVAWISQQPTLLAMMLALLSVTLYLRFCGVNPAPIQPAQFRLPQTRWLLYALAAILLVLATLAKPAMAVLPAAILIMIWWERGRISREDFAPLVPLLGFTLIVFATAIIVFHHSAAIVEQKLGAMGRVQILGPAIWFYLNELIRLGRFSFVYTRWNPTAWWNWASLAGVIVAIAALWSARRRIGRAPFASALLFVILLLPHILFVDLRQTRDSFVADSAMYAAMAAVVVPVIAAISESLLPRGREVTPQSLPPWIAAACITLVVALSFWLSRSYVSAENLWTTAIGRYPNSVYALNQLGALELNKQQLSAAREHFLRALQLDPANRDTHRNLGAYYEAIHEPDRAYSEYFAAVNADPADVDARCGLARCLAALGNPIAALKEYDTVLQYRPDYEVALNDMAMVFADLHQNDQAIMCYQRAIKAAPNYIPSHINLANLYFTLRDFQKAVDELGEARKLDPTNFVVYVNIGSMCAKLSQEAKDPNEQKALLRQSELAFREALYFNHDSGLAAFNLAKVLAFESRQNPNDSGKMKEAIFYFNKACQLEPENSEYKRHLLAAQQQQ